MAIALKFWMGMTWMIGLASGQCGRPLSDLACAEYGGPTIECTRCPTEVLDGFTTGCTSLCTCTEESQRLVPCVTDLNAIFDPHQAAYSTTLKFRDSIFAATPGASNPSAETTFVANSLYDGANGLRVYALQFEDNAGLGAFDGFALANITACLIQFKGPPTSTAAGGLGTVASLPAHFLSGAVINNYGLSGVFPGIYFETGCCPYLTRLETNSMGNINAADTVANVPGGSYSIETISLVGLAQLTYIAPSAFANTRVETLRLAGRFTTFPANAFNGLTIFREFHVADSTLLELLGTDSFTGITWGIWHASERGDGLVLRNLPVLANIESAAFNTAGLWNMIWDLRNTPGLLTVSNSFRGSSAALSTFTVNIPSLSCCTSTWINTMTALSWTINGACGGPTSLTGTALTQPRTFTVPAAECNQLSVAPVYLQLSFDEAQYVAAAHLQTGSHTSHFSRASRIKWAIGTTYHVGPAEAYISNPTDTTGRTYSVDDLTFVLQPSPTGFFVDSATGSCFGIPQVTSNGTVVQATLFAAVSGTVNRPLYNFTFDILYPDVYYASNGPNGRDCAEASQRVDLIEFDNTFTCDCSNSGNTGDNCDASPSTDNSMFYYIGAGLGAAILLLLSAFVYGRIQLARSRRIPEDLEAIQAELLAAMGLGISTDIPSDKFGLTFTFGSSLEDLHATPNTVLASDAPFMVAFMAALNRVEQSVRWNKGEYKLDTDGCRMDALVPLPARRAKSSDAIVAQLLSAIDRRHMSAANNNVVDVCLRMPKRIPREIARRSVERLEEIGEGAFGEVFKATVSDGIHPTYLVAVKAIKPDTGGDPDRLRSDLLSEAAMMALLDHSNLVELIGVITVPRDFPALLLVEYCERGSLLTFVRRVEVRVAELLSFVADTAAGLQYLATRHIIHRDVAARNVLLSSAMVAKVSDFGMSVAVNSNGSGEETGKEYIRVHDNIPIRWSAIEVLLESKYSVASDIWAFGVLVYEVMVRGAVPYPEHVNLHDVSEWVKAGNTMTQPEGCSLPVYEKLMAPCWRRDPSTRPRFDELRAIAIDLGGTNYRESMSANSVSADAVWDRLAAKHPKSFFQTKEGRQYLGISVSHLTGKFRHAVDKATGAPWVDHRGNSVPQGEANISHAVASFVKPLTASMECPRDGQRGCAYVDSKFEPDDIGPATTLLSYSWRYRVRDIGDALQAWVDARNRLPSQTYAWICSLCLNQHRIIETLTPAALAAEFGPRVEAIGRITPLFDVWQATGYISRAWCLFELYTAITKRQTVAINVIMPPQQRIEFQKSLAAGGYSAVDAVLAGIKAQDTDASRKADLTAIRAIIQSLPGGFETLNTVVQRHLSKCFEELGAVLSNARVAHTYTTSRQLSDSANLYETTYYCNSPLEPSAESQGQEAERETEDRRSSSSRDQILCALSPIYQKQKKRKSKWGNRVKPEHGQRGSEV